MQLSWTPTNCKNLEKTNQKEIMLINNAGTLTKQLQTVDSATAPCQSKLFLHGWFPDILNYNSLQALTLETN